MNIIKNILREILEEEGNVTGAGEVTATQKIFDKKVDELSVSPLKKSRRFVPTEFEFPEQLLKPIGFGYAKEAKTYFKIATNSNGESILMIDPLVKTALDSIERGRSSFSKEQNLSRLTQYLKERVPQQVRGLIKKYSSGGKITGNGFITLPLIMTKQGNTWFIQNPNKEDNVKDDINVPLYEAEIDVPENVEAAAERLATLLNSHFRYGEKNNTSDSVLDAILHKRMVDLGGWFTVSDASGKLEDRKIKFILLGWRQKAMKDTFRSGQVNELENTVKINQPDYKFWVFSENQNKIISGWEYISDAHDFIRESGDGLGKLSIYTKAKLMRLGLNPDSNNSWGTQSIKESQLDKLIKQTLLKEASYGQFKKEVKFRSKNEMLHKGIKTVKSKLQEVDRIVEYMSRMKQELSENEDGLQYWDKTKQSINKIQEIVEALNNKIKTL